MLIPGLHLTSTLVTLPMPTVPVLLVTVQICPTGCLPTVTS